jgi:DNA-binding NarL/FixJ family response regulator
MDKTLTVPPNLISRVREATYGLLADAAAAIEGSAHANEQPEPTTRTSLEHAFAMLDQLRWTIGQDAQGEAIDLASSHSQALHAAIEAQVPLLAGWLDELDADDPTRLGRAEELRLLRQFALQLEGQRGCTRMNPTRRRPGASSMVPSTRGALAEPHLVEVILGQLDAPTRRSLESALKGDRVRILASDLNGAELERAIHQKRPQVAILDERVAHSLLLRLQARQQATGLLIVANKPSYLFGTTLLAAGATCVARGVSSAELLAAVLKASRGEPIYIAGNGGQRVEWQTWSRLRQLTPREREVFDLLRRRESDGQIALTLDIRPGTVRKHTARILRKLEVKSKRDLARWCAPGES